MAPRLTPDERPAALGAHLGGAVTGVRRLSGGASRSTSAFDLVDADGASVPLIVQVDRGDTAQGAKMRTERALLEAAKAAGVPVPAVVAMGDGTGGDPVGAGGLVVERLVGETIPRKILRDDEWTEARTMLAAQCGEALASVHGIAPDAIEGLPGRDPLADPLPWLDALGEVRPALELGARWLAARRPPPGPRVTVHGDFRLGTLLLGPGGGPGGPAGGARRGARPRRRPGRGRRLALCPPVALRRRRRGRRLWHARGAARRLRGGGGHGRRPCHGALVGGLRHRQVGNHLCAAGVCPPERRNPLGRARCHRSAGLRERVGSLRAARRGAGSLGRTVLTGDNCRSGSRNRRAAAPRAADP